MHITCLLLLLTRLRRVRPCSGRRLQRTEEKVQGSYFLNVPSGETMFTAPVDIHKLGNYILFQLKKKDS